MTYPIIMYMYIVPFGHFPYTTEPHRIIKHSHTSEYLHHLAVVYMLAYWIRPHFFTQSRQSVPDVSILEVNTKKVEQLPLKDFAVTDFGRSEQEFGFEMGPACFFWTGIVWNIALVIITLP